MDVFSNRPTTVNVVLHCRCWWVLLLRALAGEVFEVADSARADKETQAVSANSRAPLDTRITTGVCARAICYSSFIKASSIFESCILEQVVFAAAAATAAAVVTSTGSHSRGRRRRSTLECLGKIQPS